MVYNGTNGAPVANPDSVATTLGRAVTFDPRANDSDPDNDPLTISNINHPTAAAGALTNNSGQTLTYTPVAGFPSGNSGTDAFSYTISDGHSHTRTGTVTVTVTDRPPVAVADTVPVAFGTQTTFSPMINDSDPDSDTLTITSPTGTSMGTAVTGGSVVRSGQHLIYTPPTGYSGVDTFPYTISDGHGNTATATETMNIGVANRAPIANNDQLRFSTHTSPPGVVPQVTGDPRLNDTDPDGDTLSVASVTQPVSGIGAVSFTPTSVTYTYPTMVTDLSLTDSFTYTISDGHGHTATANVNVIIIVTSGQ